MVLHQPARVVEIVLDVEDIAIRKHVGVNALADLAGQAEEAGVLLERDVDGREVVASQGEWTRLLGVEVVVRALFGGELGVVAAEAAVGVEEGQPDGGEGADAADYAVGYAFGAAGHDAESLLGWLEDCVGVERSKHEDLYGGMFC